MKVISRLMKDQLQWDIVIKFGGTFSVFPPGVYGLSHLFRYNLKDAERNTIRVVRFSTIGYNARNNNEP